MTGFPSLPHDLAITLIFALLFVSCWILMQVFAACPVVAQTAAVEMADRLGVRVLATSGGLFRLDLVSTNYVV